MKKYLFDEIIIESNGNIVFKSFRDISFLEIFSTCKCGHGETDKSYANRDRWFFEPKTLKQFLNCLTITKTDDGEYFISQNYPYENFTTLDDVLNLFVKHVYESKTVTKKELTNFYKKANEIKNATAEERALLEKDVEELNK